MAISESTRAQRERVAHEPTRLARIAPLEPDRTLTNASDSKTTRPAARAAVLMIPASGMERQRRDGVAWLEIINDRAQSTSGDGTGFFGLVACARGVTGSVTSGHLSGGRLRLHRRRARSGVTSWILIRSTSRSKEPQTLPIVASRVRSIARRARHLTAHDGEIGRQARTRRRVIWVTASEECRIQAGQGIGYFSMAVAPGWPFRQVEFSPRQ
jgi:hypothetical protein